VLIKKSGLQYKICYYKQINSSQIIRDCAINCDSGGEIDLNFIPVSTVVDSSLVADNIYLRMRMNTEYCIKGKLRSTYFSSVVFEKCPNSLPIMLISFTHTPTI